MMSWVVQVEAYLVVIHSFFRGLLSSYYVPGTKAMEMNERQFCPKQLPLCRDVHIRSDDSEGSRHQGPGERDPGRGFWEGGRVAEPSFHAITCHLLP